MNEVQFEDYNLTSNRKSPEEKHGKLMKFLLEKGLSEKQAKNTLITIAIIAFSLSLAFLFLI